MAPDAVCVIGVAEEYVLDETGHGATAERESGYCGTILLINVVAPPSALVSVRFGIFRSSAILGPDPLLQRQQTLLAAQGLTGQRRASTFEVGTVGLFKQIDTRSHYC